MWITFYFSYLDSSNQPDDRWVYNNYNIIMGLIIYYADSIITIGLDADKCCILEIACIITDKDLNIVAEVQ